MVDVSVITWLIIELSVRLFTFSRIFSTFGFDFWRVGIGLALLHLHISSVLLVELSGSFPDQWARP